MRLSESLRKGTMESKVGGIINKFKIHKRKDVLFFYDIVMEYLKMCKNHGYHKETESMGQRWNNLVTQQLIPGFIKKMPITMVFNLFLKKLWINLGYLDDMTISEKNDTITIITKNEVVTKTIEKNRFMIGLYKGILEVFLQSQIKCIEVTQKEEESKYVFIKGEQKRFSIRSKNKNYYYKLNYLPQVKGLTLNDAIKKKIFNLKGKNKIYFRGKLLFPVENTLFHIFGISGILLEHVADISYKYFKEIIDLKTTNEKKLKLLKNILQVMGWGVIKIITGRNEVLIKIEHPPYGLQPEKDNWDFFIRTILGYLWLIDKDFKIYNVNVNFKRLKIVYRL